jgi:hypothetical protein
MDLKKEILKEHSKKQMLKIVDYVGDNPGRFKSLIEVYLAGPYRVTQRAAWPVGLCVERHPSLIRPHLKKILDYLRRPGIHNAVKRNTIRLLQFIDIPARNQGQVAALCFEYLESKKEPVAVKACSMIVLSRIVRNEPDLQKELRVLIEDQLPYASPGFRVRAMKTLAELHA